MAARSKEQAIRSAIVEVYRELERRGMNVLSTGNVSCRFGEGMLITPTGCSSDTLESGHLVPTAFDGTSNHELRPSSEWAMHAEVYQRVPAAMAVVHSHADHCVALSTMRKVIPPFHYMVAYFGGADVPCVAYHAFGSRELGAAAGEALETRTACLLANHGMLARGRTLKAAFEASVHLETLARQYVLALAAGKPVLLSSAEMKDALKRFEDYGRQPRPATASVSRWAVP